MFGIGKILGQVLDQHNLGELSGRIDTDSFEGMRDSIEALGASGEIGDAGGLLKDISTQLSGALQDMSETLTRIVEDLDAEEDGAPVEAELVPHEAVHTLQGVAVEDDGIIATEAEPAPTAATADAAQAEEAGETADD